MRKAYLNCSANVVAKQSLLKFSFVAFSLALLLAACGDDSSSNKSEEKNSGFPTVATVSDLAYCTKIHYGEIVYVQEEKTYFECTSNDWTEVDSAKVDSILMASSSSVAADSSGPKSSSSQKVSEKDTATVEIKKVDSVSVTGFAHKGPFVKGSSVTVYGLDSLFEKTKTKFTGSVENDSGAFKVSKVVLPSQYALVEVFGYYQNEVSGKKTSGSKTTLSALVDLSAGKSVTANVNLFTDMEYARAKYLILNEKFNVAAAKKRATRELLSLFGKTVELAESSENLTATALSLFDTTAAGRILFVASLLMQGDLSASKFGTFLEASEELFAATGALDSAELRVAIADWASKVDSTDNFAQIRENVKNLKLMATVPDFESALYAFWTKEYGLGSCTDELESTIKKNENKLSDNYGAGYACTAKHWHKATPLDTELGLCTGEMEGQFKERKGEKDTEYYVCKAGSWKEISETQYELKECTEKRNNKYETTKSGEYFVCSDKQWIVIDEVTYELHLCTESRKYELSKTDKLGSYVCRYDGKVGKWEKATDVEAELGVCGGKTVKADSVYKTKADKYFQCKASEGVSVEKQAFELQPAGACTEEKNLTTFNTATLGLYVCDNKAWRKADEIETDLGVCGGKTVKADSIYKTKAGEYKQCKDGEWTECSQESYELQTAGTCTEEKEKTTFNTATLGLYVCDNNEWRVATALEMELGICGTTDYPKGAFKQNGEKYYVCKEEWTETDAVSFELKEECVQDSALKKSDAGDYYACMNGKWQTSNEQIYTLGFCKSSNAGAMETALNKYWYCNNLNWEEIEKADYETGKFCNKDNDSTLVEGYACVHTGSGNSAVYSWREQTAGEKANNAFCKYITSHTDVFKGYVCTAVANSGSVAYEWRDATVAEKATGKVCASSIKDTMTNSYVCESNSGSYAWRAATTAEKTTGGVCNTNDQWNSNKDSYGTPKIIQGYVCVRQNNGDKSYMWRPATTTEKSLGMACNYNKNCGYGNERWACEIKGDYVCMRGELGAASDWIELTSAEKKAQAICTNLSTSSSTINLGVNESRNGCTCRHNTSGYYYSCTSL